jgi:hypothetical protein
VRRFSSARVPNVTTWDHPDGEPANVDASHLMPARPGPRPACLAGSQPATDHEFERAARFAAAKPPEWARSRKGEVMTGSMLMLAMTVSARHRRITKEGQDQ